MNSRQKRTPPLGLVAVLVSALGGPALGQGPRPLTVVGARSGTLTTGGAVLHVDRSAQSSQCSPITELSEFVADDTTGEDNFGIVLAQDGGVLVVGARGDDDLGSASGSAYVFRHDGPSWVQDQKLTASDGAQGDKFGQSVDISGDRIVIGAWNDDDHGPDSGSAYSFRYDGEAWIEEQKLTATDGAAHDSFGLAVAIDGDLIVVGARGDDDFGSFSGSAYVYRFNGTNWALETKLQPLDPEPSKLFGSGVAIDGNAILIGARGDTENGSSSGAAYVFRFDDNSKRWVEESKLVPPNAGSFDSIGEQVAIDGQTVALGGPVATDTDSGGVYIFEFDGADWLLDAFFVPSDSQGDDLFGSCVHLSGDSLLVGAAGVDGPDPQDYDAGAAYLFVRINNTWIEQAKMTASDGTQQDFMGVACARFEDIVLAGAYWANEAGFRSGTVYAFDVALCFCPWDLNGDGVVNVLDLIDLVMSFGPCEGCPADIDDDGVVNVLDLIALIMNFGPCPGTECIWDVNGAPVALATNGSLRTITSMEFSGGTARRPALVQLGVSRCACRRNSTSRS